MWGYIVAVSLLVEETEAPRENHDLPQVTDKLKHPEKTTTCHKSLTPRPATSHWHHDLPQVTDTTTCHKSLTPQPATSYWHHDLPQVTDTTTCHKSLTPQPATSHWHHIKLYQVHLAWTGFKLTTLVVIGTDCIGSYKSNYHAITTTNGSSH